MSADSSRPTTVSLTRSDRAYPPLLRQIADPPEVLWVRGRLPRGPAVAIVGSRDCTRYGRSVARRLGRDVAALGVTVVSGLARGVDAAAHRGALETGTTVAVLPCGIDRVYPARHERLAARIAARGALVTENPPQTDVAPYHFPVRNRIIAGLACATVVVEAAVKSGALITARLALDADREVLAVPGPVTSRTSAGTNDLIVEGAAPCRNWQDLLAQLPRHIREEVEARLERARAASGAVEPPVVSRLQPDERRCFEALSRDDSTALDELAARTGLAVPRLLAALTALEAKGLVRSPESQVYERIPPVPDLPA